MGPSAKTRKKENGAEQPARGGKLSGIQSLMTQQKALVKTISTVSDEIAGLDVTRSDYSTALQKLQRMLESANRSVERLRKKIDSMSAV